MKKAYVKPSMESEAFIPNAYCSQCGDHGVVYNFECNAGSRWNSYNVFFDDGTPYASSDGNDEWSAPFSGYHPCHATHEADSDSGFRDGYMYLQNRRGNNTGERIDVIIWTDNGTNVHCTTNLDMNEWSTAKS